MALVLSMPFDDLCRVEWVEQVPPFDPSDETFNLHTYLIDSR